MSQVASLTLAQRIIGLEQVLRAFAPDNNWTWLRTMARRLSSSARPVRDKRARIRPIDEIEAAGRSLMNEAEVAIGKSLQQRADLYCDGLMIALLARRPFRVSNFAQIRLEENLRRVGNNWMLWFPAEMTKTRTELEMPFPEDLTGNLDRYLTWWRRVLLCKGDSDRLWISSQGKPLGDRMINLRIRRSTGRCLGSALWPHLFRDCLATYIAIEDPEHVRIATPLLGHRNCRTTERTYNLAGQRQAAAVWHAALLQQRRAAERRLRGRKPCKR